MNTLHNTLRQVGKIISSQQKQTRLFPVGIPSLSKRAKDIDPFLKVEQIGPVQVSAGQEQDTDCIPHQGIEILSYAMERNMQYSDSEGNYAIVRSGDVQLLTAGNGLINSKGIERFFLEKGGTIYQIQVWINLPKSFTTILPSYQHAASAQLPTISLDKVIMRVLSGEWNGESSPIRTQVPVLIMHISMEAGAETEVNIPPTYQAAIYVMKGYGLFGEEAMDAEAGNLVLFGSFGNTLRIKSPVRKPLEVLLIAGEPIREDIVAFGPFVMNHMDEIYEAKTAYSSGQMGANHVLTEQI